MYLIFSVLLQLQASWIAAFAGGVFDGTAESLKWHYSSFQTRFPKANPNYWNPEISWTNKYKNGNPADGVKYFGSTTFLTFTTDGYHLMRTGRNAAFMTSLVLYRREKKKWYKYVLDAAAHLFAYQVGFHLTYSAVLK